jgi:type VII secretion protein EccB
VQNRKDQLQAYQFSVTRLSRAVAVGDDGPGEAPMRRSVLGVTTGGVLGALVCVGFAVSGLIAPAPSTAWRDPGAIIVEKETGTRYMLIGGVLHPVANYASALLDAGTEGSPDVQVVDESVLAALPVGDAVGIAGAPDDLPAAAQLLPGEWTLCVRPGGGQVLDLDPAGQTGPGPLGQRILVAAARSGAGAPAEYVVWDSVKYPVPRQSLLAAVGLGDRQPIAVPAAWLDALPTGSAVQPPPIPGAGGPGVRVAGAEARVGTLFSVHTAEAGTAGQFYVALSDGLAPVSSTEAALLEAGGAGAPVVISAAALADAPVSADESLLGALPDFLSGPVFGSGASLCVLQRSPGSADGTVVTEDPAAVAADPPVVVPREQGMLVEATAQGGEVYVVADTGERYLIDSQDALAALGYSSAVPQVLPQQVLALIPPGPVLDGAAALAALP